MKRTKLYPTDVHFSSQAGQDFLYGKEKINEILKPHNELYYAKFGLTKHGEEHYAAR